MDGIFSYFPTQSLTSVEIENIDNAKAILLTVYLTSWGPYDCAFEEE